MKIMKTLFSLLLVISVVQAVALTSMQLPLVGFYNNTVNLNGVLYLSYPLIHVASDYSVNVFITNDSILQTTKFGVYNYSLNLQKQGFTSVQTQILNSMLFNDSLYISTTNGLIKINPAGQSETLDSSNTPFQNLNYVLSTSNDGLNVYANTLSGIDDLQNNQTYLQGFAVFNSIIKNNIIYAATNKGLISFNLNTNYSEVISNTPTLNVQDYDNILVASTNNGIQFFNASLQNLTPENSCFKTVFNAFPIENSIFASTPQGVVRFYNGCNILDNDYSTSAYYSPSLNTSVFGTSNGFDVINFTPVSGSFTFNTIGQNYPVIWENYSLNYSGVVEVLARFSNNSYSWSEWQDFTPTESNYAQIKVVLKPSNETSSVSNLTVNYLEITPPIINVSIKPLLTNSNITISVFSNKPVANATIIVVQKNTSTIIQLNKTSNYSLSGVYNVLKGLDGNASVEVQAWDYYGNEGFANASFNVDTTPPAVYAVLNQTFYTSESVASGEIKTSKPCTVSFNSPNVLYSNNSFTVSIPETQDGFYYLNLTAVDVLNNTNNTFIAIPIHNPPVLNAWLSNSSVPANFNVSLKFTVFDSNATKTYVLFKNVSTPVNNSYNFSEPPGNYSFTLISTDSYNLSSNLTMNFTVLNENASLETSYTCNNSNVEVRGNVTLHGELYPSKILIPQTNTLIKTNGSFNVSVNPLSNVINISILDSNINKQITISCLQKPVPPLTNVENSLQKPLTPKIKNENLSPSNTQVLTLTAAIILILIVYAAFKISDKKFRYDLKYSLKDKLKKH